MKAPEIHSIFAAADLEQVESTTQLGLSQGKFAAPTSRDGSDAKMSSCSSPANLRVMRAASATRRETARRSAARATRTWRIASGPKTAVAQNSPVPLGPVRVYGPNASPLRL